MITSTQPLLMEDFCFANLVSCLFQLMNITEGKAIYMTDQLVIIYHYKGSPKFVMVK